MLLDTPNDSQLKINFGASEFTATVRLSKNIFLLSFLTIWWLPWTLLGGYISFRMILSRGLHDLSETVVWLLLWLAGVLYVAYVWLWNMFGEEVITGNREKLVVAWDIFGKGDSKSFPMAAISGLRINVDPPSFWSQEASNKRMGLAGDSIFFEFDHKTYKFGRRLAYSEASKIVAAIEKYRLPL